MIESRLAVSGLAVYEVQGQVQIKSFPAKAGPTESTEYSLWDRLQPGSFFAGKRAPAMGRGRP
jgi:hypothetical protein